MSRSRLALAAVVPVMLAASSADAVIAINPINLYGRLDQRSVRPAGANADFGRWSCAPTSLTNSMAYLQRRFWDFYSVPNPLVPFDRVPTLVPDLSQASPAIPIGADFIPLKTLADRLADPNGTLMKQMKAAPGGNLPPTYRRANNAGSPGIPGGNTDATTPGGGDAGGTFIDRFVFAKDSVFRAPPQPNPSVLQGEYDAPMWNRANVVPEMPIKPNWLTLGTVNPENMFRNLRLGADVEMCWQWDGGNVGGHMVTVYGYGLDLDVNADGKFNPGDIARLYIIDPWNPVPGAAAPTTELLLQQVAANAKPTIRFARFEGSAAGDVLLPGGTVNFWASEVPAPSTLGMLMLAGVFIARRRRIAQDPSQSDER